jgi:serine/threonine protein kinase
MKLCPSCQHCYEDTDTTCTQAGHDTLVAGRPGTRFIAEKYRLDRLVARGGMGAVYAGTHTELERPVAIKLLLPDFNTDPKAFERFRREARAAARIKHPNIADVYDYGDSSEGEAYIVMELVEGQTLQERLKSVGQLPFTEAIKLSRQIADGMEAAHLSGVVHRDLKPSNIILARDHDGNICVKLIDFGIAKITEQITDNDSTLTATGTLVGTPRYMSPEQCLGKELDERSDIYSFGIILYEMLAGQAPFDATSAVAIAMQHLQEPPSPLEEHRQNVPPLLTNLILDTLSVEPSARPQSAVELKDRLSEVGNSLNEEQISDQGSQALPAEDVDELRTQVMPEEALSVAASDDDYATQVIEEESAKPQPLFDVEKAAIKQAVPLTPVVPAADADARPVSSPIADNSDETRVRQRRQPAYLYAVIAIAFVVGVVALWAVTRPSSTTTPDAGTTSAGAVVANSAKQPRLSEVPNNSASGQKIEAEGTDVVPASELNELGSEQMRAEIAGALNEWVAATNAGNVDRQMTFYNPTVEAFYRTRNVSRDAVRAEKERVFDQADRIEVQAGEPQIKFSDDGQTVTTRFRKRFVIEGPEDNRRGEVMQELRWIKTDAGWKIVSERDVQVLRNSNKATGRANNNSSKRPDKVVVRGVKKLFQVIR